MAGLGHRVDLGKRRRRWCGPLYGATCTGRWGLFWPSGVTGADTGGAPRPFTPFRPCGGCRAPVPIPRTRGRRPARLRLSVNRPTGSGIARHRNRLHRPGRVRRVPPDSRQSNAEHRERNSRDSPEMRPGRLPRASGRPRTAAPSAVGRRPVTPGRPPAVRRLPTHVHGRPVGRGWRGPVRRRRHPGGSGPAGLRGRRGCGRAAPGRITRPTGGPGPRGQLPHHY
jgi:hypothetical protein